MKNSWQLVSDVGAFVRGNQIWVFPTSKPKYKKQTLKLIKSKLAVKELTFKGETTRVRLTEKMKVEILHDGLWYELMNLYEEFLGKVLYENTCTKGDFGEVDFEFVYSPLEEGLIGLTNSGMKDYFDYLDEMVRVLNCSTLKKTRKLIPGHRYDTESGTYYCLCKVNSHKDCEYLSGYSTENTPAWLITRNVRGYKTVSEVLKSKVIKEGEIEVLYATQLAVDSGETLKDDFTGKFEDYYIDMIGNTKTLPEAMAVYTLFTDGSAAKALIDKSMLTDRFKKAAGISMIKWWDVDSYLPDNQTILKKKDLDQNIRGLFALLCRDSGDNNTMAYDYYTTIFDDLRIDWKQILTDTISGFSFRNTVFRDFDSYLEYGDLYFNKRSVNSSRVKVNLREGKATIDKTLGNYPELARTLKSVATKATEEFGSNISQYTIINRGTRTNPNEYIRMVITLQDLIRCGLREEAKTEVVQASFQSLELEVDFNSKIN